MRRQSLFVLSFAAGMLAFHPGGAIGRNAPAATATATPAPSPADATNTGRNVRDRSGETVTPVDQKETRSDRKITAAVRRALIKDDSLSLDAHNAKIVTRDGAVTLRGPVKNNEEKSKLQAIAERTRGVKQVDNQLEPKSP